MYEVYGDGSKEETTVKNRCWKGFRGQGWSREVVLYSKYPFALKWVVTHVINSSAEVSCVRQEIFSNFGSFESWETLPLISKRPGFQS